MHWRSHQHAAWQPHLEQMTIAVTARAAPQINPMTRAGYYSRRVVWHVLWRQERLQSRCHPRHPRLHAIWTLRRNRVLTVEHPVPAAVEPPVPVSSECPQHGHTSRPMPHRRRTVHHQRGRRMLRRCRWRAPSSERRPDFVLTRTRTRTYADGHQTVEPNHGALLVPKATASAEPFGNASATLAFRQPSPSPHASAAASAASAAHAPQRCASLVSPRSRGTTLPKPLTFTSRFGCRFSCFGGSRATALRRARLALLAPRCSAPSPSPRASTTAPAAPVKRLAPGASPIREHHRVTHQSERTCAKRRSIREHHRVTHQSERTCAKRPAPRRHCVTHQSERTCAKRLALHTGRLHESAASTAPLHASVALRRPTPVCSSTITDYTLARKCRASTSNCSPLVTQSTLPRNPFGSRLGVSERAIGCSGRRPQGLRNTPPREGKRRVSAPGEWTLGFPKPP